MESEFRQLGRYGARAVTAFARSVFPHFCVVCQVEGPLLCNRCHIMVYASLRGVFCCPCCGRQTSEGRRCKKRSCNATPLEQSIAMSSYGNAHLRELLRLYKYEGVLEAGKILRGLFSGFIEKRLPLFEGMVGSAVIVGVPAHRFRKMLRGFDQVDPFVCVLSEKIGARRALRGTLSRRFGLYVQAHIKDSSRRRRNVLGVFYAGHVEKGKPYVLVDDVMTTGATLEGCARVLLDAGASSVSSVTLLRG